MFGVGYVRQHHYDAIFFNISFSGVVREGNAGFLLSISGKGEKSRGKSLFRAFFAHTSRIFRAYFAHFSRKNTKNRWIVYHYNTFSIGFCVRNRVQII